MDPGSTIKHGAGQPTVAYDWKGYNRRVIGKTAGEVICQRCGQRWIIRRCWVDKPSLQCVAILGMHREHCAAKDAVPGVGTA